MTDFALSDLAGPTIHIIDDDDDTRQATARLLKAAGFEVRTYADAAAFLATGEIPPPACVILDLCLPGANGLELQDRIAAWSDPPPIIFVSGRGQVVDSVRAIRHGAVDFLIKPVEAAQLLEAISRALTRAVEEQQHRCHEHELRARYEQLTAREREVLAHLIAGQLNKQIAFDLGTAERTVKIHRARVLRKMRAASIPDLVRMADVLGIRPTASVA